MKITKHSFFGLVFVSLLTLGTQSFAGVSFSENQFEVALAPSCNHVPISIDYVPDPAPYDEASITVSSDSNWAIPSVNPATDTIEISFATENLFASYTATITVDDGDNVNELFIYANQSPLDVYRLVDDPLRSKTYAIHRNGIYNGSLIAFDPVQETIISCVTVGEGPSDFVINDNSTELLVINSVSQDIDVIDLDSFSVKEKIALPTYNTWGSAGETTANIDLGPGDIIYYSDAAWAPNLHVLKRSTGVILQSTLMAGDGFMDFAVSSDKTKMVAMPQYGWSAGSHSPKIGHLTINGDGTVNFIKNTTLTSFDRAPFEAPVLLSDDDQIAVMKTVSTDPANTDNVDRVFPSAIWSMNPNASVVATADKLYDYATGNELYTIPGATLSGSGYLWTKAQAFTSDFTRFVYFDHTNRTLKTVNLIDEIGFEQLGRSLNPLNGAVVNSPDQLMWSPLAGVDQYDVYLGTDENSVAAADQSSDLYLGRITGTSLVLLEALLDGTEYFWRIDPVTIIGPEAGAVYSFTVSSIALDITKVEVQTVAGHADYQVDINLTSATPGLSWEVASADSWVTFSTNTGSTPSTLSVHLDASELTAGIHNSVITLTSDSGQLEIPIELKVDGLNLTHIRNDRNSSTTYAISEDSGSVIPQAYLLEIDSAAESILRVIPVGSSVTDLAIHYADNLLYVTNWKSGSLLAIDRDTLTLQKSFPFQPAGATGYSEGDVYRVAAGASQRIIVEEEDQWVDISLYDTNTETTLSQAFVREGGGAFDPTGRYYYHGENNSSGASIIKYDTVGDAFTQIAEVRPAEISSYYGSRTVVVSEDGSRIFWSGVVLDSDLNTEWASGDIVYSSSTDGRYAFSDSAIFDVNLKRQILTMPANTIVSGYNSTTEKLIAQVGDKLGFYTISSPVSIPAPTLSAESSSYDSIELVWADRSLENEFLIQQRLAGTSTWTDVATLLANTTSWTSMGLVEGETYEFRIRASASGVSSVWSDIATATVLVPPNVAPFANNDLMLLPALEAYSFNLANNDTDIDGSIDVNSIQIVTQPAYGQVFVNGGGEVTYTPGNNFLQTDSFSYVIDDDEAESSLPATVSVIFTPTPTLTVVNTGYDSVTLGWVDNSQEIEFVVEQRISGTSNWATAVLTAADVTSWTAENLQQSASYEFRIRANYVAGYSSAWSDIVTVELLDIPSPTLAISDVTDNSVTLVWTDNSQESEFFIQSRMLGVSTWTDVVSTAPDVTAWTVGGLLRGATYEFRVRANESNYSSEWSNIVLVTVLKDSNTETITIVKKEGGGSLPLVLLGLLFGLMAHRFRTVS